MARNIIRQLAYPVVIAIGLLIYAALREYGLGALLSSYVPVVIGAILVTLLEWKLPYRKDWTPNSSDVRNDLLFLGVVQVLLPKLLSLLVVLTLVRFVKAKGLAFDAIWPHSHNVYLQALWMMLAAELLRYWLHRACHESRFLWRLHAVHHSSKKLYWTNVARFHPLEKALQYVFDTLPFVLMGVSEDVLAIYFTFYAINGFFQHCNIDLRLGFLNYIISGPELHRWHHSSIVEEANRNYGNNLILWDLVFGTWYLPEERAVAELGLKDRAYPLDFVSQMRTPFLRGKDEGP